MPAGLAAIYNPPNQGEAPHDHHRMPYPLAMRALLWLAATKLLWLNLSASQHRLAHAIEHYQWAAIPSSHVLERFLGV